jgi:hypothetical protein
MESWQHNYQDPTTAAISRVIETLGGVTNAAEVHAYQPDRPTVLPALPADIGEWLGTRLIDAGMPANQTKLYRIDGHPDLLARHNQHISCEDLLLAYSDAQDMGLPVLPAEFVKYKEVSYAITTLVDGVTIEEALANDPPAELIEACQYTWATLGEKLATARQNGAHWAVDVEAAKQFMWGTIPGDAEPRLWMVDLPTNSYSLEQPDVYGFTLLHSINTMLQMEQALGCEMGLARQQYARAVAECPDSKSCGDGLRNAARHCLEQSVQITSITQDEFALANSLRTY